MVMILASVADMVTIRHPHNFKAKHPNKAAMKAAILAHNRKLDDFSKQQKTRKSLNLRVIIWLRGHATSKLLH